MFTNENIFEGNFFRTVTFMHFYKMYFGGLLKYNLLMGLSHEN